MNNYEAVLKKILSPEDALKLISQWRSEGKKIVFTNGCFDLIHAGHIDYLSKASSWGDKMIIGLNSDHSVKKIKGDNRPVNDEKTRSLVLASFLFTDAVVVFNEETPLELISLLLPDILVKGGDYKEDEIVGADIVRKNGGKVVVLPFIKGYSTTETLKKIKGTL